MGTMAPVTKLGALVLKDVPFEPKEPECYEKVPEFKYHALHVLQAFKRGICRGIDENLELIRIGKMRFLEHSIHLEREAGAVRFNHQLRNGNLDDEMRATAHHLEDLGFWEWPKKTAQDEEKSNILAV